MDEAKKIYQRAKEVDPDDALTMALMAESTEEKRFWTYIATMNLERKDIEEFHDRIGY